MKQKEKEIYRAIDKLLWKEWDPIGVNDTEEARDEYYSYLPHVYRLKMAGADARKIADYLYQVETINMGLQGNKERCRIVGEKVKALR